MTLMTKLLLIQGANMVWLGKREPEHYGTTTAAELDAWEGHFRPNRVDLEVSLWLNSAAPGQRHGQSPHYSR
jgi:3-dehydroquinate dehydratase